MVDFMLPLALIEYPETDGQPISESDATRDYLLYSVAVLESHFQGRQNVDVSGNLFTAKRIIIKSPFPLMCL